MNQIRIFYFDDEKDHLDLVLSTLEKYNYSVECFWFDRENVNESIEKLEFRIKNSWWNLIIADMRLLKNDGWELGARIINGSDATIPKIVWSQFIDRDFELILDLIEKRQVVARAAKEKGIDALISKIKEVLGDRDTQTLEIIAHNYCLDPVARKLKSRAQSVADSLHEIEDLFRRLFVDHDSITVEALSLSEKMGPWFRVWVNDPGPENTSLVRLNQRDYLRKIQHNHNTYYENTSEVSGILKRSEETPRFGALVYSENQIQRYLSFEDLFYVTEPQKLKEMLSIFKTTYIERLAHASPQNASPNFAAYYHESFALDRKKGAFLSQLIAKLEMHPLIRIVGDKFVLRNPSADYHLASEKPYQFCHPTDIVFDINVANDWGPLPNDQIVHGELNEKTFFAKPKGDVLNPWLPASAKSGYGFLLEDLISLEAAIMIKLITQDFTGDDDKLFLVLRAWLSPTKISDNIREPSFLKKKVPLLGHLEKGIILAKHLRKLSAEIVTDRFDMRYYYCALLFHATSLMEDTDQRGRPSKSSQNAAFILLLLADRIQNWSNWRFGLSAEPDKIKLNNDKVIFPHQDGRSSVAILNQSQEILEFFLERSYQIVSRDELIENIWGDKDPQEITEDAINRAIHRVRSLIEKKGEKPKYLVTVPKKGYQFFPDGKAPL